MTVDAIGEEEECWKPNHLLKPYRTNTCFNRRIRFCFTVLYHIIMLYYIVLNHSTCFHYIAMCSAMLYFSVLYCIIMLQCIKYYDCVASCCNIFYIVIYHIRLCCRIVVFLLHNLRLCISYYKAMLELCILYWFWVCQMLMYVIIMDILLSYS